VTIVCLETLLYYTIDAFNATSEHWRYQHTNKWHFTGSFPAGFY